MNKLILNKKGVRELLRSEELQDVCVRLATDIKNRAGEGYEVQKRMYSERCGAVVKAVTAEARKDNAENNTLLKAVK